MSDTKKYWTTADGSNILISGMTTRHIDNSIGLCLRAIKRIDDKITAMAAMDAAVDPNSFSSSSLDTIMAEYETVKKKYQTSLADLREEKAKRDGDPDEIHFCY